MTLPANWRLPLAIAAAVVVADQLTKEWALNALLKRTEMIDVCVFREDELERYGLRVTNKVRGE